MKSRAEKSWGGVTSFWRANWDFFSGGSGARPGYVTDLQTIGCVLRTSREIEYRRWIRLVISDPMSRISCAAVGRIVRCESAFDASLGDEVTLYRYRVEFTFPIPAELLLGARQPRGLGSVRRTSLAGT
jgi:hypothetical protein